ncbi:MAG: class I SAM-dependent methyltransferase [Acidobacteriota bacterium]|nr:class I SAM-dependent methyltransferase [Acidobacteriota bacterium]
MRDAFLASVAERVDPGNLLLDFGCGTGTDALWYAQNGYRVIACDNSAGMIEQLRIKCADQVSRGAIVPYCSDYETFLKLDLQPRLIAVVSNFAVLSLVSDLPRFFAALAGHVAPYGYAVVSALKPLFWEDILALGGGDPALAHSARV